MSILDEPSTVSLLVAELDDALPGEHYVSWALDLLGTYDSPSLLRLANEEPPYCTPDLARLFSATFAELGVPFPAPVDALRLRARHIAREALAGFLPLSEATSQLCHLAESHEGVPDGAFWQAADEAPICDYCSDFAMKGHTSLEAAIRSHLTALLADVAG